MSRSLNSTGEEPGLLRCRLAAREHFVEELGEFEHGILDPEPDEAQRRAVVEERDEDHPARDVREVHRLLLALMEQRVEVRLADEPRQLVIGTEIGRRQSGKRRRVEVGLLPHGRDKLPRTVHEERTPGVAVKEELLERMRDRPEIFFREGPTSGTNGHGGGLELG